MIGCTHTIVLDRISTEINNALKDGVQILPEAFMILCTDEAKQACVEGLVAQQDLQDAALTLCLIGKKELSKRIS